MKWGRAALVSLIICSYALMASYAQEKAQGDTGASVSRDTGASVSRDIGVKVNGNDESIELRPIIYNGSAYLPVRLLMEKLGVDIVWNEDENAIEIGRKKEESLVSVQSYENRFNSEYTTDDEILNMYGIDGEYECAILFRKDYGDMYSASSGYINYSAVLKPGGSYSSFSGTIVMENTTNAKQVLFKFYEDYASDKLIKEIEVTRGEMVEFEIDISGVQTIYIYQRSEDRIEKYSDPVKMAILNPKFK